MASSLLYGSAFAQDVPDFMKKTYPEHAIGQALGLMGALEGKDTAIDAKTMPLIQLGVAAQMLSQYCIYCYTKAAMAAGASEAEIKAAVAAAADTRTWSTVLNGNAYDVDAFNAEVDQLMVTN